MKKYFICLFALLIFLPRFSFADIGQFSIKPVSKSDFYKFVKVFSEMRGPLRMEILKDSKADFENADPLNYVEKVKDNKDVVDTLKKNDLTWDSFTELMGNVLLAYFSIQPDKTKAGLLRQLSGYGLMMSDSAIPPEYRQVVTDVLKTDQGSAMAGMVLDAILVIPPENGELAKDNKRKLDQLFYTKFWKDKL